MSFSIRVPSLINPVHCIRQTEEPYLLKHIIHDWDDRRAIAILKNCCQALDSNGKVLVLEMVVPSGNNPSAAKMLDINMLVMCPGGKERTAEEFEELLSQAGLKLNRIIPTQEDICIIECDRKRVS